MIRIVAVAWAVYGLCALLADRSVFIVFGAALLAVLSTIAAEIRDLRKALKP